jgi:hypothetical protein
VDEKLLALNLKFYSFWFLHIPLFNGLVVEQRAQNVWRSQSNPISQHQIFG